MTNHTVRVFLKMSNYSLLKEYFQLVWMNPTPEELEDRKKNFDKSGLPKKEFKSINSTIIQNHSMSDNLESLGFHMSQGLYFKKVDGGIKITKTMDAKEDSPLKFQQVESLESISSACASCTPSGDTAEQHKRFMSLFSS